MEQKNDQGTMHGGQNSADPIACEEARVIEIAARILKKYREAFEELAK